MAQLSVQPRLRVPGREQTVGPEVPTLLERAVNGLCIPYPLFCALVAITLGYASSNFGETSLSWALWTLLAFYMLYAIRYLRLKVAAAEQLVALLCPRGEETFHRAFGRLSRPMPQTLFITMMIPITTFYFSRLLRYTSTFQVILTLGTITLFSIAWGSVFWEYCSSIMGLRELGKQPLELKNCYEDNTLGLRPLGSLSFQLTFIYLSIIGLGSLATSFFADLFNIVSLAVFLLLGIVLFFLPLGNLHRIMSEAKRREQASIRSQILRFSNSSKDNNPRPLEGSLPTLQDIGNYLADVKALLALDMAERTLVRLPTWPFDSKIIQQLAVTLASLVTLLIGQIIIVALHL